MILLDGKALSTQIKETILNDFKNLPVDIVKPTLGILQVGNLEESNIYIKHKINNASVLGIKTMFLKLKENADQEEIIAAIKKLSNETNGFIIQLPMMTNKIKNVNELLNLIPTDKDIDALNDFNANSDFKNPPYFMSATPLGILILLKAYGINFNHKTIGVIGQSKIVGKPLTNYFKSLNCNVNAYDKFTSKDNMNQNDIIIVATGQRDCITVDQVKNDVVVVDVGIHRIDNKIYGDLNFDEFIKKASYITPVPGGVGPMTVIALNLNLIKTWANKNNLWTYLPNIKRIVDVLERK
ncbi:bifunctional 5,10-methylenetetrahydrofolate dehydrogenase/5,10-methenyltetrahydrofolate cyclohydrolase [[Mycoplasma] falconis]|uniref:Bifunctional protein FolD n=1 Tax=[Mycoplasma] falconis TaxID=92403 RepID=A0A501XA83_9BACT|nr:bifunctional 5,10-methylenetetrahydrofolate dehydrogenase/5,10-methenyltetrahydrofolate cyclohydrolase [[Mycoplasma] falconis]TPE57421.1 bifunctional 5,10-methylenetetrahydrofolate dehydrogenase/5,10-methenyltetrahydrofolate cyclohydrolase [[Mycoplasma] falconis]